MNKSGFTLVELLITLAIIAVLAAVVLPRIQSATDKGQESRIVAGLESLQKAGMSAEVAEGTFNVVCGLYGEATSSQVQNVADSLYINSNYFICNSTSTAFAASAELESGRHWCVDSVGAKVEIGSALTSGAVSCP